MHMLLLCRVVVWCHAAATSPSSLFTALSLKIAPLGGSRSVEKQANGHGEWNRAEFTVWYKELQASGRYRKPGAGGCC